jgi:hypothetical protein
MASGPFKRQTPKEAVATYLAKVASSTGMVDALLGRREEHPTEVLTHDEWIDYFLEQVRNKTTAALINPRSLPASFLDVPIRCRFEVSLFKPSLKALNSLIGRFV